MAPEPERSEPQQDDAGVLGRLPNRRPGLESPRRAMARERAARREPGAAQPDRGEAVDGPEQGRSGLEELARAGAGLATGAATAGLKLAGRAAGSLGRVVGRD